MPLPETAICGACQRKLPPYHRAIASFSYVDPVAHLIHGLKYGQRLDYGRFLGEQLANTLQSAHDLIMPDCLLPVPLHRKRLMERGFNQACEIAKPVAKRFGLTVLKSGMVERSRHTAEQSQLSAKERRSNLKNAFSTNTNVNGLSIAIIDDVMTTGATVSELSRVLIADGARRVEVWVASRAADRNLMSKP